MESRITRLPYRTTLNALLFLGIFARASPSELYLGKQVQPVHVWTVSLPAHCSQQSGRFLNVTAGPLPKGATLHLQTIDGVLIGSVAPFGQQARQHGGVYAIALPHRLLSRKQIRVTAELYTAPGILRQPLPSELLRVEAGSDCSSSGEPQR